jgi:hypothetical protein
MRPSALRFVSLLCAASVFAAPLTASAQGTPQVAPAEAQPGVIVLPAPGPSSLAPSTARAPNGEYVAPMSQTTQPTYIPQSVAMSGPREIRDWEEGDAVPLGYHAESRVRRGLIVGGAVTFGVLYLLSVLVASAGADDARASGRSNQEGALWVPVAGPFFQMGSTSSTTGSTFLFIDGIGQLAGAAMLIGGIAAPRSVLVRNDLASTPTSTPMRVGKDGMGMGLTGTF